MDKALASALRARGVNVFTAHEANMIERKDEEHLTFATSLGRVLYSFNVGDYCRLVAQGHHHAGLVLAQQQRHSVGDEMRRLLHLMNTLSAEEMKNRIEFLGNW
ncbi:MAG: DUF5615 family PIN-like protein [Verrucomicrobia bacterium]|nr:DUF5615 family PIN-like protein [Verrucomicrobiota bacterium]